MASEYSFHRLQNFKRFQKTISAPWDGSRTVSTMCAMMKVNWVHTGIKMVHTGMVQSEALWCTYKYTGWTYFVRDKVFFRCTRKMLLFLNGEFISYRLDLMAVSSCAHYTCTSDPSIVPSLISGRRQAPNISLRPALKKKSSGSPSYLKRSAKNSVNTDSQ